MERHFGDGIARAYAGDRRGPATTTYIKADLHAIATAMTGQVHPLASAPPHPKEQPLPPT